MKNLKKLMVLSVAALVLSACGGGSSSSQSSSSQGSSSEPSSSQSSSSAEAKYERKEDADVYKLALPEFEGYVAAAKAAKSDSERYVKYAKAEAYLMDSGLVLPTYSQGGNYSVTRSAPRTVPYVMWGNDTDRLKGTVSIKYNADKKFITPGERAEMIALWDAARKGGAAYDPAAYLTGKGYELDDTYRYYFTSDPETFDYLATSKARDTQYLVNGVEGLLEYDQYGVLQPRLAKALPTVSQDGLTYTFEIAEGHKWFNVDKLAVGDVVADDFVAGFQHMLDAKGGLQSLVSGIIEGVTEYLKGEAPFSKVGVKAEGNKFIIKLCQPESYFLTRISYTTFLPMRRAFFIEQGGAFGAEFDPTKDTYRYGKVSNPGSILYNSAYYIKSFTSKSKIELEALPGYEGYENIHNKNLVYAFEDLSNRKASYDKACDGTYLGWGLTTTGGVLDAATQDGNFAKYAFKTDTNAVTFFGGMNINRGTFEVGSVKSLKTEQDKIDAENALLNANFRRAIQQAWDRKTWRAISVAEDLATAAMRNMYTAPEFCALSEEVTYGNHVFTPGTTYGEVVEYFLKNDYKRVCTTADAQDGWFNAAEAVRFAKLAKDELTAAGQWNGKPQIEIVYDASDDDSTKSAKGFEQLVEKVIGDYVDIVCLAAANTEDQLATSYDAAAGVDCCYDISWDSGWGPDWGDPSTYVDTYLPGGDGYMTKIAGLW